MTTALLLPLVVAFAFAPRFGFAAGFCFAAAAALGFGPRFFGGTVASALLPMSPGVLLSLGLLVFSRGGIGGGQVGTVPEIATGAGVVVVFFPRPL